MGGVCGIGSIKGRLSPIGSLQGTLSIPVGGGLPEGSEMATDDDIDSLIDDIFGTGVNPDPDEPTYSPDDIATEKELNDAITDVFG